MATRPAVTALFARPTAAARNPRGRFDAGALRQRFVANWRAYTEAHGVPSGARVFEWDEVAAVDLGRPSFGANAATLSRPVAPGRRAAVTAELDRFYGFPGANRTGTVFLFEPWPENDFAPRGWTFLGEEPLMARPADGPCPPDPPGLQIAPVCDVAVLRAFERVVVRGFEAPDLAAQVAGAVFGPAVLAHPRFRLWVGWERDRPVGGAAAFVADGITSAVIVATVPEARQKGYATALTWRASLAQPELPALLMATDEGRAVYERMGYAPVGRVAVWCRDRGAALAAA